MSSRSQPAPTPLAARLLDSSDDPTIERFVPRPVRPVWSTTLHASGIRLRSAAGWAPA